MDIETISIKNKKVYIFESHHFALLPWHELAKNDNDIVLITFDHHTDTIPPPFLSYDESERNRIIGSIKENPATMLSKLRNDQHIQTALECGIINQAFVIPHNAFKNISECEVPFSIEEKLWRKVWHDNDLYSKLISCDCHKEYENFFIKNVPVVLLRKINIESESKEFLKYNPILRVSLYLHYVPTFIDETYDSKIYMPELREEDEDDKTFLEDSFLKKQFLELSRMSPNEVLFSNNNDLVIASKFILDIDLDYFHNFDVLDPKELSIFKTLVSNAEIITIARESTCVDMLKNDDSVTSERLLTKLLILMGSIL